MKATDVYIGQYVRHVRGEYAGQVRGLVEQPEPAPLHVDVQTGDGRVFTVPINQLLPVHEEVRVVATVREGRVVRNDDEIPFGEAPAPRPLG